ncbi:MAG TPA: DUF4412 domain-containing protein [Thermoanaerobaculia bacterium]|nr:DUF4412 domain-containing protein [Thermoanaerobaculia bacterium]
MAWIGSLAMFLSLAAPAGAETAADTLLTVTSHTDAFTAAGTSQPARDAETRIWVGSGRVRRDENGTSEIFRFDLDKLYLVYHADKSYSELDLPIAWAKLAPKGSEHELDQYIKANAVSVQLKPTAETRKIRGWKASRVEVEIANASMKLKTAMWVSKDGGLGALYETYNRMAAIIAALQPGSDAWAQKIEKLDGCPVLQETTVELMGTRFKSREELVSAEIRQAPPGTYEVPADYTSKPYEPRP